MNKLVLFVSLFSLLGLFGCQGAAFSAKPVYGNTNPTPERIRDGDVKRYGSVIELLPEKEQLYRELHADVWLDVVNAIKKAKIRNYNIYVAEIGGKKYLFSYLEYTGIDPDKDFGSIALDPTTKNKWWPITDACQKVLPGTPEGEQWVPMEMLIHID